MLIVKAFSQLESQRLASEKRSHLSWTLKCRKEVGDMRKSMELEKFPVEVRYSSAWIGWEEHIEGYRG